MKLILFFLIFSFSNFAFSKESRYFGSCIPNEPTVTQTFVIDNDGGESFSQSLKKVSKNSNTVGALIIRYPKIGGEMLFSEKTIINTTIGHQGLAIQYIGSDRFFWGSLNKNNDKTSGNYLIRYKIKNENIVDLNFFKIFSDFETLQSTTPTISYDGKYLIAKMTRFNEHEVKIFKLDDLSEPGDYSDLFYGRFKIKRDRGKDAPKALQSLASDGNNIYVLNGSFSVGETNYIDAFTFNGVFVKRIKVDHGERDAAEIDSGVHYEPESLTWLKKENGIELILQIAAGDKGKRKCLLYFVGVEFS